MLELLDLTQTRGVQSEDNASGLSGISKQEVLNRCSSHVSRRAKVRAAKMPLIQPSTFHCNHTIIQDCL